MVRNPETIKTAERYWSGKPSIADVEKIVARMKKKEESGQATPNLSEEVGR